MQRTSLQNYRGFLVTADTAKALHDLEDRASQLGKWRLDIMGVGDTSNPFALASAGREVHFRLHKGNTSPQEALNAAWACAVPLGFTPNDRWPRPSNTDHIFYFLGPWRSLNDRLLAEGRGHLAWPSVCIAAQCDVGAWRGDKPTERFVQAQLHRMGRSVGPIDGVIGRRTKSAMQTLNLSRPSLQEAAEYLLTAEPEPRAAYQPKGASRGHVAIPGHRVRVQAFGDVRAVQHGESGAAIMADGDGRLVIEVEKG